MKQLLRRLSLRSGTFMGLVLAMGVSTTVPSSGWSGGINVGPGSAYYPTGCPMCHTGSDSPTISWFGPSYFEVSTSDTGYVRITSTNSGTLGYCGFNAWVSSGSLSLSDPSLSYTSDVQVLDSTVAHTSPQTLGSGNACRFRFDFDPPASTQNVTLSVWGNNVNGLNGADAPDSAALTTFTLPVCRDNDGDGNWFGPAGCPNTSDCDDNNSNRSYLLSETCDGVDNDCDNIVDEGVENTYYRDADGDGYGNAGLSTTACSAPVGYVSNSTDCDDSDSDNYPTNAEVCDGQDNNCSGVADEGVTTTYYRDLDGDGYGNSGVTIAACSAPNGYVSDSTDCNDSCSGCHPGATETCDGLDNNCVGGVDESTAVDAATWYRDVDGDGYGNSGISTKACSQPGGYVSNSTDCADGDSARHPGHAEWCDNKDNDCNGATAVDVGCDDDNDDHCDASMTTVGTPSTCQSGSSDCADNDAARHPGHAEWCDNKDNDCNGATAVDVGCDDDNDNYCDAAMTFSGSSSTCPNGGGDCNDDCVTCYPGRAETCDGEDNDCNNQVDDNIQNLTCGQGICERSAAGCINGVPQSCTPGTPGTETCANVGTDDDCDGDANEISHSRGVAIYDGSTGCNSGEPGVCGPGTYYCQGTRLSCAPIIDPGTETEICDNLDNDCDGALDEACDDDNDNYCDANIAIVGTPSTCTSGGGDCNDSPSGGGSVNPGASESCANLGVDNDCDGDSQELTNGVHASDSCTSANPGICTPGNPTCLNGSVTCTSIIAPGSQAETCDSEDDDCDGTVDNLPALTCGQGACANTAQACSGGFDNVCTPLPSSSEICDNIDNDCDGQTDEGCDDDNDNYCDAAMTVSGTPSTCTAGGGDCDDTSVSTHPGAAELCDTEDNDCDGDADETEDIALAVCGQGICQRTGTTCEPSSCTPGMAETEICDDLDNDCDGDVDEGCDDDGDGYCDDQMVIEGAPAICPDGGGDCDDDLDTDFPGSTEVCDQRDNDCDGQADEVEEVPLATCGVGFCMRTGTTCDPSSCEPGSPLPEICDGIDNDCDGLPDDGLALATCGEGACFTQGTSCLPSSCIPLQGTAEIWDAVDNDCDGQIDEGADDDGDGYCENSVTYISSPFCPFGGGDCNDENADTHPFAEEICDGADNNCEVCGVMDDCSDYIDNDIESVFCGKGECRREGTMCVDGVPDCEPGPASETDECDGLDNDCDGIIDNGAVDRVCGVGECMVVVPGCNDGEPPDCDALALPPTDEVCDGLDNDCDGRADENRDELCDDGLCIAGTCVSNDDLKDAGIDPEEVPEVIDDEFLLYGTAGASAGGAASYPEPPETEPNPETPQQSPSRGSSSDKGSCTISAVGGSSGSPVPVLLMLLTSGWYLRSRRRRSAA